METNIDLDINKEKELLLEKILKLKENQYCSDCKINNPIYVSIKFGVFICKKCAICHMSFKKNISLIKSTINAQDWPFYLLKIFAKINNKISNDYWEYSLEEKEFKELELMEFLNYKYIDKVWAKINEIDPITRIIQENNITLNIDNLESLNSLIRKDVSNLNNNGLNTTFSFFQKKNSLESINLKYSPKKNDFSDNEKLKEEINGIIEEIDKKIFNYKQRVLRERLEIERLEKEKLELLKKEKERLLKEKLEKERKENERRERERREKEKEKREQEILLKEVNEKYELIKDDLPIPFFLDEKQLEKIQKTNNDKCIICLESINIQKQVLYLPCSHLFHSVCIMHWLLTNNKCPTCKEDYRGIKEEVDELDEERINFRNIFSSYLDFNNNIFFNDFNDDDNDNDNDSYNSYRPRSSFINNRGNWRGENGRGRGRGNWNNRGYWRGGRGRGNWRGRGRGRRNFRGNNNRTFYNYNRGNFRGQRRTQRGRGNYFNRYEFERGRERNFNNISNIDSSSNHSVSF